MRTVSVKASSDYDVVIGTQLLPKLGEYINRIRLGAKAAIISDSNVWPLYGDTVVQSLESAGISSSNFVFCAGEASKNPETYFQILNFLSKSEITRSDIIIALGGGVVGDITGFAAATYLRGITYIQIPTSLLAMVDSSVGGKTAIDLPSGKNLVGAFKQPALVLCDVAALKTLPDALFLDGCAEVIKYAVLYDAEMASYLLTYGPDFNREDVIAKCVGFKCDVVHVDEFDTGLRQKLNLGHTIGHGIEARSNYKVTHGQAVAAGMAIVTKAALNNGYCDKDTYEFLIRLLTRFQLPVSTEFTADELFCSALSDKKRTGGSVNLIVPQAIGDCQIVPVAVSKLESFIKAGL